MSLKAILIFFVALVLVYVGVLYVKVEITTSINIKEFENIDVPVDLDETLYKRIFNLNRADAKLLYKLKNGDIAFVYFTREPVNTDITQVENFGPWEYDRTEYVRQKSTGKKGLTFPLYF